jgi:ankyrin repeat protein
MSALVRQKINLPCRVIDGLDWRLMTPLMAAASADNLHALKHLLLIHADPNIAVEGNGTALMHAKSAGCIKALLEKGARTGTTCSRHGTALIRAMLVHLEMPALQALLEAGADVNQMAACDRFAVLLEHLIVHRPRGKWEKEVIDPAPRVSALMVAAAYGNVGNIELLLAAGADLELRGGPKGYTALMMAVAAREPLAVRALLEAHADANAVALDGSTPLYLAGSKGDADIVRMLKQLGAARQ